jgi:hypothetical protein
MNRPQLAENKQGTHVSVPADALDDLLESIWYWAFEDYLTTPAVEQPNHIFNTIVRLDAFLHGITMDESWDRIEQYQMKQKGIRK